VTKRAARRTNESGLSLVEVILALGLLGAVLISIAGMFVVSEKQVESGKTSTEALAVARTILEEVQGLGFQQTYEVFGLDGTAATYQVASDSNAYAGKWQTTLDESIGRDSVATIDIASVAAGTPPSLDSARAIRVTVTIGWTEGERPREVVVSTVRM
jgi:Tfp pilus assembly protein PilV